MRLATISHVLAFIRGQKIGLAVGCRRRQLWRIVGLVIETKMVRFNRNTQDQNRVLERVHLKTYNRGESVVLLLQLSILLLLPFSSVMILVVFAARRCGPRLFPSLDEGRLFASRGLQQRHAQTATAITTTATAVVGRRRP